MRLIFGILLFPQTYSTVPPEINQATSALHCRASDRLPGHPPLLRAHRATPSHADIRPMLNHQSRGLHPAKEVDVHRAEILWQDTSSTCRLQLPLQHTICA